VWRFNADQGCLTAFTHAAAAGQARTRKARASRAHLAAMLPKKLVQMMEGGVVKAISHKVELLPPKRHHASK